MKPNLPGASLYCLLCSRKVIVGGDGGIGMVVLTRANSGLCRPVVVDQESENVFGLTESNMYLALCSAIFQKSFTVN